MFKFTPVGHFTNRNGIIDAITLGSQDYDNMKNVIISSVSGLFDFSQSFTTVDTKHADMIYAKQNVVNRDYKQRNLSFKLLVADTTGETQRQIYDFLTLGMDTYYNLALDSRWFGNSIDDKRGVVNNTVYITGVSMNPVDGPTEITVDCLCEYNYFVGTIEQQIDSWSIDTGSKETTHQTTNIGLSAQMNTQGTEFIVQMTGESDEPITTWTSNNVVTLSGNFTQTNAVGNTGWTGSVSAIIFPKSDDKNDENKNQPEKLYHFRTLELSSYSEIVEGAGVIEPYSKIGVPTKYFTLPEHYQLNSITTKFDSAPVANGTCHIKLIARRVYRYSLSNLTKNKRPSISA